MGAQRGQFELECDGNLHNIGILLANALPFSIIRQAALFITPSLPRCYEQPAATLRTQDTRVPFSSAREAVLDYLHQSYVVRWTKKVIAALKDRIAGSIAVASEGSPLDPTFVVHRSAAKALQGEPSRWALSSL
jgi:hypothetical protein